MELQLLVLSNALWKKKKREVMVMGARERERDGVLQVTGVPPEVCAVSECLSPSRLAVEARPT